MQLENRKLKEEKVNDNRTGAGERRFHCCCCCRHVMYFCSSPSMSVNRILYYFVFFCNVDVFLKGETEKKLCNLIYDITIFMLFFTYLQINYLERFWSESVKI